MSQATSAPPGFDEAFFVWLDEMTSSLYISFASRGSVPESDVDRLEQRLGRPLPADIRRFYRRYNPWDVLRDWHGWDRTERVVAEAVGATAPLVPIDCRSYSSQGCDVVALIHGPEQYEVVERSRATGVVRRYADLRSYFVSSVEAESRNDA